MKTLTRILAALVLTGCATTTPPATVRIEVPVPVYCNPPDVPPAPVLPIDALPLTELVNIFVVARALWASLELLEGQNTALRGAVEACRAPATP